MSAFALPPTAPKKEEPFALSGFSRIDHKGMPKVAGLDKSTWQEIFPPDRERVLRRAAVLHYRHQMEINEAILVAISDIRVQDIMSGTTGLSFFYNTLAPHFPAGTLIDGKLNTEAMRFAMAVDHAAENWSSILTAEDPGVAAWIAAGLMPEHGGCLMSGKPLRKWSSSDPDSYVLTEFREFFQAAGPVLISLIYARCLDRQKEHESIAVLPLTEDEVQRAWEEYEAGRMN